MSLPEQIPNKKALLTYLASIPLPIHRRELTKYFNVPVPYRKAFRMFLKDLEAEGDLICRGKYVNLPSKATLKVPPTVTKPASTDPDDDFKIGVLSQDRNTFYLNPVDRKDRNSYPIDISSIQKFKVVAGDFVRAEPINPQARRYTVVEKLCAGEKLYENLSQIAIHKYQIRSEFPNDVLRDAARAKDPELTKDREDIRTIPLVTIDDRDARDHDDAVYAEPDDSRNNPDGWRILVAIADVAHYVKADSPLDEEAFKRGNSVYFPDRVVPMLPENLSNNLCSLVPNKDRYCLAVWLTISKTGKLISKHFFKGLMKSHAKLTYAGVESFLKGQNDGIPNHLDPIQIRNLYDAFKVLKKARRRRGTLELELSEHKILFNSNGEISEIKERPRLETNELIEEMMVLANVAAAEIIAQHQQSGIFRIHDEPREERIEELRLFLSSQNLSLSKGRIHQKMLNQVLQKAKEKNIVNSVSELVLRSQSQAAYNPDNIGHYGLNLPNYTHFTSPIRRYADLIVHRFLSHVIDRNAHLYDYKAGELESISEHISNQERVAAKAERETVDRYVTSYFQNQVGESFSARVSGITEFALFLTLQETGSDGILPLRNIQGDYFSVNAKEKCVKGRRSQIVIRLGDSLPVTLESANLLLGSLVFSHAIASKVKKTRKTTVSRLKKRNKRK